MYKRIFLIITLFSLFFPFLVSESLNIVAEAKENQQFQEFAEFGLIVKLKSPKSVEFVEKNIINRSKGNFAAFPSAAFSSKSKQRSQKLFLVQPTNKNSLLNSVNYLRSLPEVESVQPNYPYIPTSYVPNVNPNYSSQWYLKDTNNGIWAESAWEATGINLGVNNCDQNTNKCGGDSTVKVAVIDSGVNTLAPDFAETNFDITNSSELYDNGTATCPINDEFLAYVNDTYFCKKVGSQTDDEGHGTAVASVIAMSDNNLGGIGVAYNSTILPISLKGQLFSTYGVAKGIEHAVNNGAKVINLSLATPFDDPAVKQEIDNAENNGVITVVSAGNCGNKTGGECFTFLNPSSPIYNKVNPVVYPAGYTNVITVGAADSNLRRSAYSGYGSFLDLVAPVGNGVVAQDKTGTIRNNYTGSSFAAPQVTGAVALLKIVKPDINQRQAEGILRGSSKDINVLGRDNQTGNGLLNISDALKNIWSNWSSDRTGSTNLASFMQEVNGILYQTRVGLDSKIYTRSTNDMINWTNWSEGNSQSVLGISNKEVYLADFTNKLYQVHVGTNSRIYTRSSANGLNWSAWVTSSYPTEFTAYPTSMTTFNNKLYQVHIGRNFRIYTRSSSDGQTWSNWTKGNQRNEYADTPVNMAVFNNRLYQVHRGRDKEIYTRSSSDGQTWTNWTKYGGSTELPVGILGFNSRLYQVHRGSDRKIYTRYSKDGQTWSIWSLNSILSSESTNKQITLSSFQGRLYESHIGGDNFIYNRVLL